MNIYRLLIIYPIGVFLGFFNRKWPRIFDKPYRKIWLHYYSLPFKDRKALITSMVEPIRRALDYQAVGRKLLMVDELPQGAYANYQTPAYTRYYNHLNYTLGNITAASNTSYTITTSNSDHITISTDPHTTLFLDNSSWNAEYINNTRTTGWGDWDPKYGYDYDGEETQLNNYLIDMQKIKEEKFREEKRKEITNPISNLQLND